MPVALTIGPSHTLTQNETYAAPARRVLVRSTGTLEVSLDASTWSALTTTNNQAENAAPFIRSTASGTIVSFKVA